MHLSEMSLKQKAAFSQDSKYFSTLTTDNKLLVWDTSTNIIVDYELDVNAYGKPISLYWIPDLKKCKSPKKSKIPEVNFENVLALGTAKGDLILYNVSTNNLFLHLVARHSDSVNDVCYCSEEDLFYTCSSDKSIAVWNGSSGFLKSNWKADDHPIYSLCLINKENLLSSSKSILLWNISEKIVLKKFRDCSSVIFKMLPVNIDSSVDYFLSVAVDEEKINVWSLCLDKDENPIASFESSGVPKDVDISCCYPKKKSVLMCCVTDTGYFQVFENTLNRNINKLLKPRESEKLISMDENQDLSSIFAVKFSKDLDFCSVAHGSNNNITFLKKVVKGIPEQSKGAISNGHDHTISNEIKEPNGTVENSNINGLLSPPLSPDKEQKPTSKSGSILTFVNSYKSSSHLSGQTSCIEVALLHNEDEEIITKFVKNLPRNSLKWVLLEISQQLEHKYHPALKKWLHAVLRIHMQYIATHSECSRVLCDLSNFFDRHHVTETVKKINSLKGLLSLFELQNVSDNESDSSSDEESMEL